ncbi:MAG: response regulator transcription factor [Nitrospiraceae bacterium]
MTRRIVIADDHPIVRQGLLKIVTDAFTPIIVREADCGQAVLDLVRKEAWDAIVLDITLPDKNGLDVLKDIRTIRPAQRVLMLSFHSEEQYAIRALKAGAAGYLTKDHATTEIVHALTKVFQGGRYVSAALAERLADQLDAKTAAAPHEALSDREHEVLCLLAQGKTPTEIGDLLAVSVKTVSTYRARVLEKLNLQTTAELIRYALDHKLVE